MRKGETCDVGVAVNVLTEKKIIRRGSLDDALQSKLSIAVALFDTNLLHDTKMVKTILYVNDHRIKVCHPLLNAKIIPRRADDRLVPLAAAHCRRYFHRTNDPIEIKKRNVTTSERFLLFLIRPVGIHRDGY